jgi:hypothetical protein
MSKPTGDPMARTQEPPALLASARGFRRLFIDFDSQAERSDERSGRDLFATAGIGNGPATAQASPETISRGFSWYVNRLASQAAKLFRRLRRTPQKER